MATPFGLVFAFVFRVKQFALILKTLRRGCDCNNSDALNATVSRLD